MISANDPYTRKYVNVLGSRMAYVDEGEGAPIVLLHGNPTSSYLWRNIIPHLPGRRVAPDLMGMGRSDKPDISYRFVDHARYLEAFFDAMKLERVTLVIHDWGSALGFDWAMRHQDRVEAIAFMEPILAPVPSWSQFPDRVRETFQAFRTPAGEKMIFDDNVFIERLLPSAIVRKLTEGEMEHYRAPFRERASRRPMLVWPTQIPVEGDPADVTAIVTRSRDALAKSPIPKLLFTAEPGGLMQPPLVAWCKANLPNLTVVPIGAGIHYLQEDHPDEIGRGIAEWLAKLQ